MSLSARLAEVQQSIREAEIQAGRKLNSVRLIAVSKKHQSPLIAEAVKLGQFDFAENYVQDAVEKMVRLQDTSIRWHFIGRIQKNKTQLIARHFSWVHSLSDINHARRLDQARAAVASPLNVCVQVNIDRDPAKSGVAINEADHLVDAVQALPHLKFRGFMCITRETSQVASKQRAYADLAALLLQQRDRAIACDTLSMGMSSDYEIAVAAGATMVRIGTAIFGERQ